MGSGSSEFTESDSFPHLLIYSNLLVGYGCETSVTFQPVYDIVLGSIANNTREEQGAAVIVCLS